MKILRALVLTVLATAMICPAVQASVSESYTYNLTGKGLYTPIASPAPYRYLKSVSAHTMGVDTLSGLTEIVYYDGFYFITCGAKLIITDDNFTALSVISGVTIDGEEERFTELNGVFVTRGGELYLCEPQKGRILHYYFNAAQASLRLARVLGKPEGITIKESVPYQPIKVAVDSNGRIYAIALNVYEGIVEMNPDGSFSRYFGVVKVRYTLAQLFWRSIRTQAQRALSELWLPVNYTNLTVDHEDFVYATVPQSARGDSEAFAVAKMNAKGTNILRHPNNDSSLVGDLSINLFGINIPSGPSVFSVVDVTDYGVYYVYDKTRNRVFAYDEDGYLLFAFGGEGAREGHVRTVTDMSVVGDFLVLTDKGNASIEVFELTEYGRYILSAAYKQYHTDYMGAAADWERVLYFNPYFQYAYVGVGKALYREGHYEAAARYFELGQDVNYYSMAYQKNRSAFMTDYFTWIVLGLALLVAAIFAPAVISRVKAYKKALGGAKG